MADSCCGKTVDVAALEAEQKRVLITVLIINAATFVMVVAAALMARSSSLLSGGLDNLGDALTYAMSLAVVGASMRAEAKVAVFKGLLILGAAVAVGVQIALHLINPAVPVAETMGLAALLNLAANAWWLKLLSPYRDGDVNMASAWECSRNDVWEGFAVLAAAAGVWLFGNGWPDLIIAVALLLMFLRSSWRVLGRALNELRSAPVG